MTDVDPKAAAEANASGNPPASPPVPAGTQGKSNALIYVLIALVAVMVLGGGVMVVACAGAAIFLGRTREPIAYPEANLEIESAPYDYPMKTSEVAPWSVETLDATLSAPDSTLAPAAVAEIPAEPTYDPGYLGDGTEEAYDPDWQLELPQYQQDAIQELQSDRP